MGKLKLGSGQPQKNKPFGIANVNSGDLNVLSYDDSKIKLDITNLEAKLKLLESREPQIIKEVNTVVEKQPEIHQHVYPVQEAKDLDLLHLVTVERYETEFKMLNQSVNVLNKSLQDVTFNCSSNINDLNSGINIVKDSLENYKQENTRNQNKDINNLLDYSKMIEQDLTKKIDSNGKLTSELVSGLNKLNKKINKSNNKIKLLPTISNLNNLNNNMNNQMKKRLKTQKIINILLAVGLILSLIK